MYKFDPASTWVVGRQLLIVRYFHPHNLPANLPLLASKCSSKSFEQIAILLPAASCAKCPCLLHCFRIIKLNLCSSSLPPSIPLLVSLGFWGNFPLPGALGWAFVKWQKIEMKANTQLHTTRDWRADYWHVSVSVRRCTGRKGYAKFGIPLDNATMGYKIT